MLCSKFELIPIKFGFFTNFLKLLQKIKFGFLTNFTAAILHFLYNVHTSSIYYIHISHKLILFLVTHRTQKTWVSRNL